MNDWQPTMQIREVWHRMVFTGPEGQATFPAIYRIEQLYRHIHTGDTEWRPIERVEES